MPTEYEGETNKIDSQSPVNEIIKILHSIVRGSGRFYRDTTKILRLPSLVISNDQFLSNYREYLGLLNINDLSLSLN